jgi:protease II
MSSDSRISLLDRGFAYCHSRMSAGGDDLGYGWFLTASCDKQGWNTFNDFVDAPKA